MQIEIEGSDAIVIPESESYTMEFHNTVDVSGFNHCNKYGAKYTLASDGSIFFREITQTEMGCPQPSSNTEFSSGLVEAKSLQVIRNHLRLYYADGTRVLHFVRRP